MASGSKLVIYIPGLADHTVRKLGQAWLLSLWRWRFGIKSAYHVVSWNDPHGDFYKKRAQLVRQIDTWAAKGYNVSLVASSAGASLALHAYAQRKDTVHAVVLICPKIHDPDSFIDPVYKLNPTFKVSMQRLPRTLAGLTKPNRHKILVAKPKSDRLVDLADMDIKDAHYLQLPSRGHLWSIVAALSIYARRLAMFIAAK